MEEQFDIYTESGTPTGDVVPRSRAHKEGLWHQTAHIWIYHPKEGLLLQKRSATKESHPSLWDISAAGHVPAGESIELAAIRECEEEVGVLFEQSKLSKICTVKQIFDFPENSFHDREHVTIYLIDSDLPLSAYKAQPEEVEALRFIAIEELKKAVEKKSDWLVPHWEEYDTVISYLTLDS